MPKTTITFNGLLVFARAPKADYYELGVLRARGGRHTEHIFQISVDPPAGIDTSKFDPDALESYVQDGHVRWSLEVESKGQPVRGIVANANTPANRMDASQNPDDFGWLINIEQEFHNGGMLPRQAQQLQPIIELTKGRLFTRCKTDMVDKARGGTKTPFGFIAGSVGLEIDTAAGEEVVLSFMDDYGNKTEIFRLTNTAQQDYEVSIKNTPIPGGTVAGAGHFHLFYERLFTGVGHQERCDIPMHFPVTPPSEGRCEEDEDPDPDPFRCGGVRLNDGSGPLT